MSAPPKSSPRCAGRIFTSLGWALARRASGPGWSPLDSWRADQEEVVGRREAAGGDSPDAPSWRACRSTRLRYRRGESCQFDLSQPSREIPVGFGQTRVADRLDARPIGTTPRPLEAVDSVDVSGDRHDVGGGSDELHRRGPVQREFLAAAVHHRRQVAVTSHDDQPAGVRQGPGALTDTIPLAL